MEKEFYHFECLKSLRNIPELQLQEYCNILKKLKEEFVVHRFRVFQIIVPMTYDLWDNTDIWGCLHPQQRLYVL